MKLPDEESSEMDWKYRVHVCIMQLASKLPD